VEVALFFQNEILKGAAPTTAASEGEASGTSRHTTPGSAPLPVLLLTNDNSQLLVAKAHGLPAYRLSNVDAGQLQVGLCERRGSPALPCGVPDFLLTQLSSISLLGRFCKRGPLSSLALSSLPHPCE